MNIFLLQKKLRFQLVQFFPSFRPGTEAIYHTHSPMAVIVSLMVNKADKFRCKDLQMVKALSKGKKWTDILEIPIIENKDKEEDIAVDLEVEWNYFGTFWNDLKREGD